MAALPVYAKTFGAPQAERLLWRAGLGPRPGEARGLARRGLEGAVDSQGTDHGAAGVGFLIGSRVRGGMIGEYPGL